jgi:carboxyl-terminal processing protease
MPARRRRHLLLTVLVALVAGLAVLSFGVWIGGRHPDAVPKPVRASLTGSEDRRVVNEALDLIESTYYRKIPRSELADDAIGGVVAKLKDRFSNYFTPAEYKAFQQSQSSSFTGVGVSVAPDPKGLRVVNVFDGSPAKRAGIVAGDVFVAADGKSLAGLSGDVATARVKGPSGTDVRLTILHDGKRATKTLTRSEVSVPVVASTMRHACGKPIGVVALAQFSSGAHAEVYAALKRLQKKGAKGYVFDLRGNGGGLVDEAQLIASAFLPDGKIVTTRGRNVPERTLDATGTPILNKDDKLVVLVDGNSASASEIVAGALQDRKRATLVGTRTFGKGVFQEVIELSNGGALDITAGQYFTPNGRNLGGRGVATGTGLKPDVFAKDNPKTRVDEGLRKALRTAGGCAVTPAK